jgi:hypothetical protein
MAPDDYRANLLARQQACIRSGDVPGRPPAPCPTGDFVFNAPSCSRLS